MALKVEDASSQLANNFTSSYFDPEKYVKDLAAECDTDAQLQEHRKRVQTLSEETAISLKRNVYKNYMQFIETSKEISYLEAEMYQLGHLLAEQKAILTSQQDMSLFEAQDSSLFLKPSKKDEKSSSSIESVEGLSSVLDISDIICIFEGDLMETDPVTFLPKLKVHAFLLHDSLVVASIIQNRYYINLEFCHFIFLLYILDIMLIHLHLLCSELQIPPSSVHYELPVPIEESSMGEPTIEDQPFDDQPPPLTFEVVEGASKRGQQKLFDNRGYSYCVKRRRNAITYWHCSFRGKSNHCPASVIQRPEGFTVGVEHNHTGEVGLPETAKLTAAIKRKATDDLFRSASVIVDEVLLQGMENAAALPTLARPEYLARAANRCRQSKRPQDPVDLDFTMDESSIPGEFLRADIETHRKRHLIFATEEQLTLLRKAKRGSCFVEVGKSWLRDLPEDLDMFIAQRDFERAMELIDRTNQYLKENSNSKAAKEIRVRLDRRVKRLVEVLVEELDCSRSFLLHVGPRATRRAVSLLVRLGRASEACDLFLRNRSEAIKYSLRYRNANTYMLVSFVVWANSELKHFVTRFSCQVFRGEMGLAAIGVCLSMAKQQCEKLHEIGLDLTFSMLQMLEVDIVKAFLDTRDQMLKFARHKAKEGNWKAINFDGRRDELSTLCGEMESCGIEDFQSNCVAGNRVELSSSTVTFTKGVLGYLADGLAINSPKLQDTFVSCIADLFENQVVQFDGILKSGCYAEEHDFILKNASFVLETILPLVKRRLKVAGSQNRLLKIQHELKRLQAISPCTDSSEAEGQTSAASR
ncbi:PREDICTED: uncharacterized protein LOC107357295 [Acropora digitifera]|uniref:uncharacterized protein LOC107357295 n=1 Tax=Acropora digitifera TaxID=70779 RepID=UPI00077ABA83|nr:PREDICTED: uncharacterized protein LOC107357295 [Acropora digitifera]